MRLPHDELGSGPAVVLLHAGVADRTMWSEHLGPLADAGLRVVAMDLPGFGEAAIAAGAQAPWADVLETMDSLGIERAALVGSSFGGAVALRVAVVAPGRVTAMALISAPGADGDPSPELAAAWEAEEEALARGDIEAAVRAVVEHWTLPGAPADLRERVAAMQRRAFSLQEDAGPVSEAPDPAQDWFEAVAELRMPVLVVSGEHDKSDFDDAAQALADAAAQGRRVVLAGAGHLAPLEAPLAFREQLLGFLRANLDPPAAAAG